MPRLDEPQIQDRLARLDGWDRDGQAIRKTYRFDDFPSAVAFVDRVVEPAERADHHPDIDIRYDRVVLSLSTHSEGGLTEKDFELAQTIDALESPGT